MSRNKSKHDKPAQVMPPDKSTTIPEAPTVYIRGTHILIRLMLIAYLLSTLALGYWYWMRPVRADQFKSAHEKWRAIAKIFHVPVPKDERWGW
jgi:hypothetical protein